MNITNEREVKEMKKIYDRKVLVKVDGWKEFDNTSMFRHLRYKDEDYANQDYLYRFETFEEAKAKIEEGWTLNAESTTTFFTKQPKLKIGTVHLDYTIMTKRNFKPIEVKIVYKEEKHLSIKELADLLDADSFCEYLNDRNISSLNF